MGIRRTGNLNYGSNCQFTDQLNTPQWELLRTNIILQLSECPDQFAASDRLIPPEKTLNPCPEIEGRPFDLLKNVKVSQVGNPMAVVGGQSETRVRPLAAFRVYIEDQSNAVNLGLVQFQ